MNGGEDKVIDDRRWEVSGLITSTSTSALDVSGSRSTWHLHSDKRLFAFDLNACWKQEECDYY